jgi:hypothetical protein
MCPVADFIVAMSQEELRLSWPITLKKQLLDDCDQINAKKERRPRFPFSFLAPPCVVCTVVRRLFTDSSLLQLVTLPRTPCVSQILDNYVKQASNKKSSMVSKYVLLHRLALHVAAKVVRRHGCVCVPYGVRLSIRPYAYGMRACIRLCGRAAACVRGAVCMHACGVRED